MLLPTGRKLTPTGASCQSDSCRVTEQPVLRRYLALGVLIAGPRGCVSASLCVLRNPDSCGSWAVWLLEAVSLRFSWFFCASEEELTSLVLAIPFLSPESAPWLFGAAVGEGDGISNVVFARLYPRISSLTSW